MKILEVTNVLYGPSHFALLRKSLSFELLWNQKLIIRGPNGSGKSTLLRVILGQLKPFSGLVNLNIQRKRIAYLPQLQNREFHIPMTLRDVLSLGIKGSLDERKVESIGLLSACDLKRSWNTASGGERNKALLTQIFLQDVDLLVLDEPINHLDTRTAHAVRKLIDQFIQQEKKSVLMVSHHQDAKFLDTIESSCHYLDLENIK